uniref:Uncharacterized protein n=1 Tax=Arundo donax TaxID=35708 RepID=A0A0A9CGU6_ARUDO
MLNTISQKDTFNRLSGQLGVLSRCKKHIAHTAKKMKDGVVRRLPTKTLIRNPPMKS